MTWPSSALSELSDKNADFQINSEEGIKLYIFQNVFAHSFIIIYVFYYRIMGGLYNSLRSYSRCVLGRIPFREDRKTMDIDVVGYSLSDMLADDR